MRRTRRARAGFASPFFSPFDGRVLWFCWGCQLRPPCLPLVGNPYYPVPSSSEGMGSRRTQIVSLRTEMDLKYSPCCTEKGAYKGQWVVLSTTVLPHGMNQLEKEDKCRTLPGNVEKLLLNWILLNDCMNEWLWFKSCKPKPSFIS